MISIINATLIFKKMLDTYVIMKSGIYLSFTQHIEINGPNLVMFINFNGSHLSET